MDWNKYILAVGSFAVLIFSLREVSAHCPLCTIGAGAAAAGAVYLGVSKVVVSLFIGAFAVSTGWWVSKIIKKKYIPYQKHLIILASFLLTIIPIMPIMETIKPFYLSLFGDYGTLFNRTYLLNMALFGSIFGGGIVYLTPLISSKISKMRGGRIIPFQGVILTLTLLIIAGGIIQLLV